MATAPLFTPQGKWLIAGAAGLVLLPTLVWLGGREEPVPAAAPVRALPPAPRPQAWVPSVLPAPAAPAAVAPAAPPYSVLGSWSSNGRTAVMLKRGGSVLTVNAAGPLDADYAVHAIAPDRIVLKQLASGALVALPFEAGTGTGTTAGAAPGPYSAPRPIAPPPVVADSEADPGN